MNAKQKKLSYLLVLTLFFQVFFSPFFSLASEPDSALSHFSPITVNTSAADILPTSSSVENKSTPTVQAPSVCLMEASTGQILYEKDADSKRRPASITKIMTLILIFDALEKGSMNLSDEVVTSSHAKSMGGSQVFLEEGEVQNVDTLIKCIVVASGNDASVAMAEYIAGSEEEFVRQMNERAAGLGMTNTHFEDCCGLTDSETHVTTARDIAIMSRELITRYPQIHNYSTIWMDTITHVTNQGSKEFGLSNTNKLLKMATNFEVTGLKTGSTSLAKYCLSATARKDGVHLIASIMAAPDYKARFSDAISLLNYGFANCRLYTDTAPELPSAIPLSGGIKDSVSGMTEGSFSYLFTNGEDFSQIEKTFTYSSHLEAPVTEGDIIGSITYSLNQKELGSLPVKAAESVRKATYIDSLKKVWESFL
ncbi:MAG: D-alanyl-D-alanine carboxypeptidase family protein [bacterium]|nr:D-alanyl-D-alanine carboxypeptidase family protein [bacterium]